MITWTYLLSLPTPPPGITPSSGSASTTGSLVRDLALDDTGDLLFSAGDLGFVHVGIEGARQGVQIRTNFVQGEWFDDLDAGIPFWDRILVKAPNLVEVKEWFQLAIFDAPDIVSVDSMNLTYTGSRQVALQFTATAADGLNLTGKGNAS